MSVTKHTILIEYLLLNSFINSMAPSLVVIKIEMVLKVLVAQLTCNFRSSFCLNMFHLHMSFSIVFSWDLFLTKQTHKYIILQGLKVRHFSTFKLGH